MFSSKVMIYVRKLNKILLSVLRRALCIDIESHLDGIGIENLASAMPCCFNRHRSGESGEIE